LEFDFVIVGAGSAGCVLASRLSAETPYTVALIEAGGRDRSPWIHIPVGYYKTMGNPRTDWCYRTQPDPGLNGRSIPWPRGKTLGGSSSINGLLYVRGQARDFDHWRQMGNAGWGWDDVLPYFRRSETWELNGSPLRGDQGPLRVSATRVRRPIVDAWLRAAVAAGYKENPDYNAEDQEGVAYFQQTAHRGRRCSTATAYLRPAMGRANLEVLTETQVTGLSFEGRRVVGVKTLRGGEAVTVKARREVVLSAGAIASPQLLMVSGIGAPEELRAHDINVNVALEGVGRNLQDHLQARPVYCCRAATINTELRNWFRLALMGLQYALSRSGPMTMAASLGTGFLKTRPELESPDIQFHIQPFSADSPAEGPHRFSAFTASVLQLRPESRGHISLTSADMRDHPAIHPNYLSTRKDCATVLDGVRIARRIARQEPLASLITSEWAPGEVVADDDALLEWIRDSATTIYHPTGTCKMGIDPLAVTDTRLRVHGMEGLRVADASIMPAITSGNTNAPTIMIGEKASDMIIEDARS
jgi:choline dehydrogenase